MSLYPITPVPKPRQTKRDKWAKRPCVMQYRAFADEVRLRRVHIDTENGSQIIFTLPMPKSWSKKKRAAMNGKPHQQVPDKDNLEKALLDAVLKKDEMVWNTHSKKVWGERGSIEVMPLGKK